MSEKQSNVLSDVLLVFHVDASPESKKMAFDNLATKLRKKILNTSYIYTDNRTFKISVEISRRFLRNLRAGELNRVVSPDGNTLFPGDIRNILASLTGCPVLWIDGGEDVKKVVSSKFKRRRDRKNYLSRQKHSLPRRRQENTDISDRLSNSLG